MSGLTPLDDVSGHIGYDDGGANAPYDHFNIEYLPLRKVSRLYDWLSADRQALTALS